MYKVYTTLQGFISGDSSSNFMTNGMISSDFSIVMLTFTSTCIAGACEKCDCF